jgi:hypothetical protein
MPLSLNLTSYKQKFFSHSQIQRWFVKKGPKCTNSENATLAFLVEGFESQDNNYNFHKSDMAFICKDTVLRNLCG